jgi:chlorocatechol 1,2-dioxygenase
MNKRLEAVVSDIVKGVRGALTKHDATFDGYCQELPDIMKSVGQCELPLLIGVFPNTRAWRIATHRRDRLA